MSERISTRATMSSPAKRVASTPSAIGGKPYRPGVAGWRHGSIDEGERLSGRAVAAASDAIRAALLIGDWPGAVAAMLSARGEPVNAKGLEIEPDERGPALTAAEADYVAALSECHLTRTDLVVGAQELCRLSRWTAELSEIATDRARYIKGKKVGTASMSMSIRRRLHHEIRLSYLRSNKNGGVAWAR